MHRLKDAAAAACLLLVLGIGEPQAQQAMLCGLRGDMGEMLAKRFGEVPQAAGVVGDRVVELLVSRSGSWTILITSTDGRACVVTGGEDWTDSPVSPPSRSLSEPAKPEKGI
jgi:hypothetical protein